MSVKGWASDMVDFVRNPKRYASDGEEVDLDEQADPSTWRDESKPTITERLASRKRQAIAFSFIGAIVLGLIGVYSSRYLPGLYQSELAKEALKWMVVLPATFIGAASWQRGKIKNVDRLDLLIGDQTKSYYGAIDTDSNGNLVFTPIKGFDLFGLRARQLTLGDMSDDFARSFAKWGRDADDPARIRIEDGLYGSAETATGEVAVAITDGLEVDEFGRESDLYTKPPDMAPEEKFNRLTKTLQKAHEENSDLRDRVEDLEEKRDEWREEAKKDRKQIIDEFVETHGELADAGFGPRGGHNQHQTAQRPADINGGNSE